MDCCVSAGISGVIVTLHAPWQPIETDKRVSLAGEFAGRPLGVEHRHQTLLPQECQGRISAAAQRRGSDCASRRLVADPIETGIESARAQRAMQRDVALRSSASSRSADTASSASPIRASLSTSATDTTPGASTRVASSIRRAGGLRRLRRNSLHSLSNPTRLPVASPPAHEKPGDSALPQYAALA